MYERFLQHFTEFIFAEGEAVPSDVILIPGNGYPQMAKEAAALWRAGYAPLLLPSGKYSVLKGCFDGVKAFEEQYRGPYATEWEFLADVLKKEGVPEDAILREEEATYTYENAIYSRRLTDRLGITVNRAMICCQSHHARRCLMYYQLLYPEAELVIRPVNTVVSKTNWYKTAEGIDLVLGEIERCGGQFHKILRDLI